MNKFKHRAGLCLALAVMAAPLVIHAGENPKKKNEYFNGKVVPLAEIVAKQGGKLDADAAPYWLALVTDEGKIHPLVKDDGSRMFFKDAKLLRRPMRLTGRLIPGGQLLQVINVHSYVKGTLHEVYYWCDICTIRGYEAGVCDCCLAPLEFREVPIK